MPNITSTPPSQPPLDPPSDGSSGTTLIKKIENFFSPMAQKTYNVSKELFQSKLICFFTTAALGITLGAGAIASFSFCCISIFGITVPAISCLFFTIGLIFFVFARLQQTGSRKNYFWAEYQQVLNFSRLTKRQLSQEDIEVNINNPSQRDNSKDYYSPICYLNEENTDKVLIQSAQPQKGDDHDQIFKVDHNVTLVIKLTKPDEDTKNIWTTPVQQEDWDTREQGQVIDTQLEIVSVEDYKNPSIEQIDQAIEIIENHQKVEDSGSVVVHCMSGIGRSTVIVLGYLLKKNPDWTLGYAKEYLQKRRAVAGLEKADRNRIYIDFMKTHREDFSIETELQGRKEELLSEGLKTKEAKKQILKEYKGIENLKELCQEIFSTIS